MTSIGIIGGSGLYDMAELTDRREERTRRDAVRRAVGPLRHRHAARKAGGVSGAPRRRPPAAAGELNFRANIFGFKTLGVEFILSASAVGSLKEQYRPLDLAHPGPVLRSHEGTRLDVLRPGTRRPRRVRASILRDR